MTKNNKGQSTLEYVILVTAVIVVIISLLVGNNSLFRTKLNTTLNGTIDAMDTMQTRWANSMDGIGQ